MLLSFNKCIICIICIRRVCYTVSANSVQFVSEFFHGNIRKVARKYVTFPCFFYMNIVVRHKINWKMIRSIQFDNSCFKFGFGKRVDKNLSRSCCGFLSNACRFVYDCYNATAKHNINKILYLFILFEIKPVYIETSSHYYLCL